MIVDIVDKYRTDDNNPIKNLRLKPWQDDQQGIHPVKIDERKCIL